MITLPTDTYYRGYRLSHWMPDTEEAVTYIFFGPEMIDSVVGDIYYTASEKARVMIDEWLNAK